MKYYYLSAALPKISLKTKPDISFNELMNMLKINLVERDIKKVGLLRKFVDLNNLKLLWLDKEINPHGNLNTAQLEDEIIIREFLGESVFWYLEKYDNVEDRLNYFSFLIVNFFREVILNDGFLKFYFKLEREIRLILTALRAKKIKRDLLSELQFEDLKDDFVEYILAQIDADTFEPPKEYMPIKNIYKNNLNKPLNMHIELLKYKFDQIENFAEKKPFTIDQILSYTLILMIVEDFFALNLQEGQKIVEEG